jgi:hypothetical protein
MKDLSISIAGLQDKTIHIRTDVNGAPTSSIASQFSGSTGVLRPAGGGHILGPGGPRDDIIPALLSNGEYVVQAAAVDKYGVGLFSALNARRYADGGSVKIQTSANGAYDTEVSIANAINKVATAAERTAQAAATAAAAAASAASGAMAGPGQSFNLIIDFMRNAGIGFTQADPGLGRGGHSWHEAGEAVDFSGGDMTAMANFWMRYAPSLLELIHSPSWYVKNGAVVGPGFYGADIVAQHFNHVHVAASLAAMQQLLGGTHDSGGLLKSGSAAVNQSGATEAVLTNAQWKAIERLAAFEKVMSNPQVAAYLTGLAEVAKYLKTLAAAVPKLAEKFTTFVTDQTQYRDSLQGQLTTGGTFTDLLSHSGTPGDLKTLLAGKNADLRNFAAKVTALKKRGYPDAIIREISSAGVDQGSQYADLLLAASSADKASIISGENQLVAGQLSTANMITKMTEGLAPGLKNAQGMVYINQAIFSGGDIAGLTQKAALTNFRSFDSGGFLEPGFTLAHNGTGRREPVGAARGPLVHIENVNSPVDFELYAKQAAFLQSTGHF